MKIKFDCGTVGGGRMSGAAARTGNGDDKSYKKYRKK